MREVDVRTAFLRRAPGAPSERAMAASATLMGPAPHSHPRGQPLPRIEAAKLPRSISRLAIGILVLLAAGVAAAVMSGPGGNPFVDRDRVATLFGFGIDQVSVTGHRHTADSALFDALDLARTKSLASFDAAEVRRRFEQLPWIRSAEITRIWPGELRIRVTERQPFAVWETSSGAVLIDQSGRTLSPVKAGASVDLLQVSGEGAEKEAARLAETLVRHPEIARQLTTAERVGGRRWTLHLKGGSALLLPPDAEGAALDRFAATPGGLDLAISDARIIDLRAPKQIAFRPAVEAAPARTGG